MHELLNDALDLVTEILGGPSGYDGKWRWLNASKQPAELYLSIEDPNRLYLHIDCDIIPIKFSQFTTLGQLRTLLDYIMKECG